MMLVSPQVAALDAWIRTEFVAINTALEEAYFEARSDEVRVRPDLARLRVRLAEEGLPLADAVHADGRLPDDADACYELLGVVGHLLGALRRHDADGDAAALAGAWALAGRLGATLGVAPRFVFPHQAQFNTAVDGVFRTFTALADERRFIIGNALGVLAYQRAAEALARIGPVGVSSPLAGGLLETARLALEDVLRHNRELAERLDVDRFFHNVRPYFKPHRVGAETYRGVNAGDFSAVNEIDLALGLCRMDDPFYAGVVHEKRPYLPPADQARTDAATRRRSLLDAFDAAFDAGGTSAQLRANARRFLAVCGAHGAAYAFHHGRLVLPFLADPAAAAGGDPAEDLTASGPPLPVVLAMLERLRDLRAARGAGSARPALERLRGLSADPAPGRAATA